MAGPVTVTQMKVAICTPVYGDPTAQYTSCLVQLAIHTIRKAPQIDLSYVSFSGHLIAARNKVAETALNRGADFLLWIDADMGFPPHGLLSLLTHNLPVVGCNYPTRESRAQPTVFGFAGGKLHRVYSTPEAIAERRVEPVWHMGLGFVLVSAKVARKLPKPMFRPHPDSPQFLGEDRWFFEAIHAAGEEVHVDHALSREIQHASQITRTIAAIRSPDAG
jgi:hypothetical protein